MKQVLQNLRSHEVRVEEVPPPCCMPGGVLVKTVASLISSGTERASIALGEKTLLGKALERPDLVRRLFRRLKTSGVADVIATVRARLDTAVALGYSSAGVVVEVGEGAEEFAVGDRVACAGAGHAGHAEVSWIPKNLSVKIPPNVTFEAAASVAVGAIALQGVRVAEVKVGERVAVTGLGLVGQLTAQILQAAGCVVWGLDPDPERVRLAQELGVSFACENRAWEQSPYSAACRGGEGADAVIITAATRSNEPIELAGELARDRGVVVVVGDVRVDIPREHYYKKELQVRYSRSYGPGRYDPEYEEGGADYPYGFVRWTEKRNMEAFLALVAQQKVRVEPLLTHRFSIDEALQAFEMLSGERKEKYVGILLGYPDKAPSSNRVALQAIPPRATQARGKRALVGVGWIGAGSFSRAKLLPRLRKMGGLEFLGLANATGASAQRVAKSFGFRYCSTDPNEILNDPGVQAVFIGTRHHLHAPLLIAALEHAKYVFVEKPLCIDEAELDQIAESLARTGGTLTVGFNRRFSPFARECLSFFAGRREPLSILYRVNAGRLPHDSWIYDPAQGGGRVISEVCHFVDLASFLTSSLPTQVQAWPVNGSGQNAEDNLHMQILLADGSRADILYLSSGDASVPKERVEVSGEGRTAVSDDFRSAWFYSNNHCRSRSLFSQDKGHGEELRAFVEAVAGGGEAPTPFASLRATTLATFRLRESLRCGKALGVSASDPI
jgi:predicted dehydrogenase/threonine dehydrogenase-like Zn-dependent dehydrogenase